MGGRSKFIEVGVVALCEEVGVAIHHEQLHCEMKRQRQREVAVAVETSISGGYNLKGNFIQAVFA